LDGGGSSSPTFMVIAGVVGIICAVLVIISTIKDENQNSSDKGCLVTFFGILIAIAVLILMSKCGG
jgi:FtsH-binding integral membrane protein